MEVILKEDVNKLGHRGDVVKVADGYGRNYLLPRKLAIEATAANKAVIEQMKALGCTQVRQGEGRSRGAWRPSSTQWSWCSSARSARTSTCSARSPRATSRMQLEAKGFTIDRRKISLDEPLKTLGEFHVPVKLHREVTSHVKVTVKGDQPEGRSSRRRNGSCNT